MGQFRVSMQWKARYMTMHESSFTLLFTADPTDPSTLVLLSTSPLDFQLLPKDYFSLMPWQELGLMDWQTQIYSVFLYSEFRLATVWKRYTYCIVLCCEFCKRQSFVSSHQTENMLFMCLLFPQFEKTVPIYFSFTFGCTH